MATLHSTTRIREAAEASGTIGIRAAARKYAKYGITESLIRSWIKNREVQVAKVAAFAGDTVLLDEATLRRRISVYTPHRDNAGRKSRTRSRTIPEMRASASFIPANGHYPAATGGASSTTVRPAPVPQDSGEVLLLNTREYLDRFYADQARGTSTGQLNAETKKSYDWAFVRFAKRFEYLPMHPVDGRKALLDYIHGLTNLKVGGPLSGGAKSLVHRNLSTLYNWLNREHGFTVPSLKQPKIARRRERAVAIWPNESRATLKMARNHSEKTILVLLAQTAMRLGELCTIRPENLHDHWVEVWGKGTRANLTGYRRVPIPDEAFQHLQREMRTYGELVWVDTRGIAKPLAGPLEAAIPGRAIDKRNPETFQVQPMDGAVKMLQPMLRRLMKDAGVYELGKGAHSFRRAYQAEFVKNGGDREFYRLIMGHFQVSDMDDLYTHATIEDIVEQARKYAPTRFLQDEAETSDADLKALDDSLGAEAEDDDMVEEDK